MLNHDIDADNKKILEEIRMRFKFFWDRTTFRGASCRPWIHIAREGAKGHSVMRSWIESYEVTDTYVHWTFKGGDGVAHLNMEDIKWVDGGVTTPDLFIELYPKKEL
ncbi:unnamed protein product [marine sediment metagenome]|uniref:Uncharacterized protein n=1 Tax=marine sediment metagenome TaxID=412755 RepID=X0W187_9ZZZZ